MKSSVAQIVATLGPASHDPIVLCAMVEHQLDVIRLNFSWSDLGARQRQIALVRSLEKNCGRRVPIIIDLPGPRIQEGSTHTYDVHAPTLLTDRDKESIAFAAREGVEYIALSFVGGAADIAACREAIGSCGGTQKIIAKIERAIAVDHIDEIIAAADAIMIARGDLGSEVPIEQIPFVQREIIRRTTAAAKPVIVATQMLLSMTEHPEPTRAEVSDVSAAIVEGADAVMLSEETAIGRYPVEAVAAMEKIILEAERHIDPASLHHL